MKNLLLHFFIYLSQFYHNIHRIKESQSHSLLFSFYRFSICFSLLFLISNLILSDLYSTVKWSRTISRICSTITNDLLVILYSFSHTQYICFTFSTLVSISNNNWILFNDYYYLISNLQ